MSPMLEMKLKGKKMLAQTPDWLDLARGAEDAPRSAENGQTARTSIDRLLIADSQ
jgi:hypothetical protein